MKERNKCIINGNLDAYKHLRNTVSKQIEIEKKRIRISLKLMKVGQTLNLFGKYLRSFVQIVKQIQVNQI